MVYTLKLIEAVRKRPTLYDPDSEDYSNRRECEKLWIEIANELNRDVSACRVKWTSLRCCYRRHLNNMNRTSSDRPWMRRFKKPSPWYLADKMDFLRKTSAFTQFAHQPNNNEPTSTCATQFEKGFSKDEEDIVTIDSSIESCTDDDDTEEPLGRHSPTVKYQENQRVPMMIKPPESEDYSYSTSQWVKTTQENRNIMIDDSMNEQDLNMSTNEPKQDLTDATLVFFKGLLPDISKLSERGLRLFKQEILLILNRSLDDQEHE